jgi:hypothetical protein
MSITAIKTVLQPRAYDGKLQKLSLVKDYEHSYTYTTDTGYKVTYVPEMWITTGVYDMEIEIEY